MTTIKTATGYDGNGYNVGDRVELHPGCDLWAMGARYGIVSTFAWNKVHVVLDKRPNKVLRIDVDRVKRID